jgi:hypothetical protein
MATVRQNRYVWDALVETANEIILFLQQNEDGHDEDDQRTFEGARTGSNTPRKGKRI